MLDAKKIDEGGLPHEQVRDVAGFLFTLDEEDIFDEMESGDEGGEDESSNAVTQTNVPFDPYTTGEGEVVEGPESAVTLEEAPVLGGDTSDADLERQDPAQTQYWLSRRDFMEELNRDAQASPAPMADDQASPGVSEKVLSMFPNSIRTLLGRARGLFGRI